MIIFSLPYLYVFSKFSAWANKRMIQFSMVALPKNTLTKGSAALSPAWEQLGEEVGRHGGGSPSS